MLVLIKAVLPQGPTNNYNKYLHLRLKSMNMFKIIYI